MIEGRSWDAGAEATAQSTKVTLLQTADAVAYADLLAVSSQINRAYAQRHGFAYESSIGIERGYHPWHACFNRILILNRMIADGYRDWIFYLDADAYVFGQDHDVRDLIARASRPMIFGPGGPSRLSWDLNDGVFLMNLGDPAVQELLALWRDDFLKVSDDELRAAENWEDVASDQPRLQRILMERPDLNDRIYIAERRFFNDFKASFVRQVFRDRRTKMADRISTMQQDLSQIPLTSADSTLAAGPLVLEVDQAGQAWAQFNDLTRRQQIREARFRLPEWYRHDLDPLGTPYRDQQVALWRAITGRADYLPDRDEEAPEIASLDHITQPAFYASGDATIAGDHLMALGHLLKISGFAGDRRARILEYGAGFGQIALAFARLGHCVETVDINAGFCQAVATAAERYRVDLTPHLGTFGYNPSGRSEAYDVIYFYESFHHCLDFQSLVRKLRTMLKPNGKVLLAGEPIAIGHQDFMPYPWGIRLDGENVAITHFRGWMELGFQEDFLLNLFRQLGFSGRKHVCPNSSYATTYEFSLDAC